MVTIVWIWFCCSATPLLANCTSTLKPASVMSFLKMFSARTQFSEVFLGSATPIRAPWSKPLAAADPPLLWVEVEVCSARPQADRVRATAETATTVVVSLRM